MLLATLIPSRPRCARRGQRCPKADLGKPELARGERQDLAPTSTPTPTAVSPGHFLPHLHGSPLAHKAPVHPLERKPPSPQKDSLMRGRQADLSPFCPLPGSPPAVTNLPSCTEQPCSVAWAAPDTLKGHGKSPPPSPIPTPASFHTLNTVPSTFAPLPTTIPGAASSSDCLLTIRDRWLRVQKRVGAGSRPHSSKGARRKALGVREDWLGCCSGGREGGGWGPEPRLYPDLLFSVAPDQGQRAGYRGWVQSGQCSGTAPLLWVPQLSADWRPPLSPRGGLQAWGGKHGHYLSPNSHSPSGPSFLGTGQTPSPQLLLAPREAGRGVPRGGGVPGTHNRCQSSGSSPGLSGSKALWASRDGVKIGHQFLGDWTS